MRAVTTGLGDMLGFPKGMIVNLVLKHVKKMVPDYDIPGAVRFSDTLTLGRMHQLPEIRNTPEDLAFLQYTGGTTGVSKGAMLTHRNLVANMQQAASWVGTNVKLGEELIVTALPLYHIFALTSNCLVFMKFGAANLLITNPRDMPGFVKELKAAPFTAITGVNTLFNGLLNTPGFDQVDFSRLHLTLGGGMAVQRAVAEKWKQVTGVHPGRSLRPDRDLAGGLHQPAGPARLQRLDRPAGAVHRRLHQGRRRQHAARSARSANSASRARR